MVTHLEALDIARKLWPLATAITTAARQHDGGRVIYLSCNGIDSQHVVDANGHPICHDDCIARESALGQPAPEPPRVREWILTVVPRHYTTRKRIGKSTTHVVSSAMPSYSTCTCPFDVERVYSKGQEANRVVFTVIDVREAHEQRKEVQ